MNELIKDYMLIQRNRAVNVDTSYRCIFRCGQCQRQRINGGDMIKRGKDISEEDMQKLVDFYWHINFCGQISDPIYHPRFLKLLQICEGRKLRISTVGSRKKQSFWDEAYSYNKGKTAWTFGVDGIDESSEIHRIGSSFKDTWSQMKKGVSLGHIIIWQYIVFDYNENDMDTAIQMAKDNNFVLSFLHTGRTWDPNQLKFPLNYGPSTDNGSSQSYNTDTLIKQTITTQYTDWVLLTEDQCQQLNPHQ